MTLNYAPRIPILIAFSGAALACQEPGADWVPSDGSTTGNTSATATTGGGPTSATNATSSNTTTDGATTSAQTTSTGTTSATSSTGAGGASSTSAASSTTATQSTSDATANTVNTSGTATSTSGGSGNSLITNGDFSAGETDWSFAGNGTVDTSSGEYCVSLTADGEVSIGWPNGGSAAAVQNGVSYELSYRAYYSGGSAPTANTKVGQAFDPYAPFVEEDITLTTSAMTFAHDFSMSADDQAGVLFRVTGTNGLRVCFDDVVLVAQ